MIINWDMINRIASIVTILGLPAICCSLYDLFDKGITRYDMYKEPNGTNGEAVFINNYTRREFKIGKKQNPLRKYHKRGYSIEDESSWV